MKPASSKARHILQRAQAEGIILGVRGGRLTYRGASPALTGMLKAHEGAVVEYMGERFGAWDELMREEPKPIRQVTGRHITERTNQ